MIRAFLKKPTDAAAFALTPLLHLPAPVLRGMLREWVVQALADRLPTSLLQTFSPQTLKKDPQNVLDCNPLMAVYWAYFYTPDEGGEAAFGEPRSNVELEFISGVNRDKFSAWLKQGCAWLAERLSRREALSAMGVSPTVISKIGEYQMASVGIAAAEMMKERPYVLWIHGKISGLGKTVYAIRLAEHLTETRRFARMVYLEFQRPNITAQPFAAAQLVARLYDALTQASESLLSTDEMLEAIQIRLGQSSAVVVLDNLETVQDVEPTLARLMAMNPETGFIFVSRLMSGLAVRTEPVPELTSPERFIQARVGLERRINPDLLAKIGALKPLYPLFMEYVVAIVLKNGSDYLKEFLDAYRQPSGQSRGALDSFMRDVFNVIWSQIDFPAQCLAMSLLLSSPDGARKDWLERVSGLDGAAFDGAVTQLENTPFWTQGNLSGYWGAHAATRGLLMNKLKRPEWDIWVKQRRLATLQWLKDGLIRLDNLSEVVKHLDSIHTLFEMFRQNQEAFDDDAVLQTLASYMTISFERGAWKLARDFCEMYLLESPLKPTSLTGLLAVQEMAVVWADIYSSVNGSSISNKGRTQEILDHLDRIQDRLTQQFTGSPLQTMIEPLLDVARALASYNRGGVLPQARAYIDNALNALSETEMGDTLAFARGIAGFIYWRTGDLRARENFGKALRHYQSTGQNLRSVWIESNIALAYDSWLELNEAEQMVRDALRRGEALGHQRTMTDNTGTLALILLARGDLGASEAMFYHQAELIIESIKSTALGKAILEMWRTFDYVQHKDGLNEEEFGQSMKREVARTVGNMGIVLLAQKHYKKAVKALQLDLALGHELRPARGHAETRINLAVCHHRMGDNDAARTVLQEAHEVAHRVGHEALKLLWERAMALLPGETAARLALLEAAWFMAWQKARWLDMAGVRLQQANLIRSQRQMLRAEAVTILRRVNADEWADRVRSDNQKDDLLLPLMY